MLPDGESNGEEPAEGRGGGGGGAWASSRARRWECGEGAEVSAGATPMGAVTGVVASRAAASAVQEAIAIAAHSGFER
jgi:hypothetical protein